MKQPRISKSAEERTARLQTITAALSRALTPQHVVSVMIEQGIAATGACAGAVALLTAGGDFFEMAGQTGYDPRVIEAFRRFPAAPGLSLTQAVRRHTALFLSEKEIAAEYPLFAQVRAEQGHQGGEVAVLPLIVGGTAPGEEGEALGILALSFSEDETFTGNRRAFLGTLTLLCAQALERARLYETERNARREAERRLAELTAVIQSRPDAVYPGDTEGLTLCKRPGLEMPGVGTLSEARETALSADLLPPSASSAGSSSAGTSSGSGEDTLVVSGGPDLAQALHDKRCAGETVVRDHSTPRDRAVSRADAPLLSGEEIIAAVSVFTDITELNRTEKALRSSQGTLRRREQHLRSILDSLHAYVGVLTLEGFVTAVNRAALEVAGIEAQDVLGKSLEDTYWWSYSPQAQAQAREAIRRAAAGEAVRFKAQVRAAADRLIDIDFSIAPLRGSDGRIEYLVPSAIDVTEHRQAQEELRRSEEFLKRIIASSADCIKVLDLDGRLLFINEWGRKTLEIEDPSVYQDQCWCSFWKGKDHRACREAIEKARSGGGVGTFHGYCPTATGTPKWWDVQVTPMLGSDGRPERLLAVSRDVTERRRLEQEREWLLHQTQESAAELAAVVNSIPDALLIGNNAGLVLANAAALDALGCESVSEFNRNIRAYLRRLQIRDASTGESIPLSHVPFFRALHGDASARDLLVRHARLGQDALVRSAASPIFAGGRQIGVIALYSDLIGTRQRALIGNLLSAQEEERRAVAYELHDGLTQYVMTAHAHLDTFCQLRSEKALSESYADEALNSILEEQLAQGLSCLKKAVVESRRLVNNLRALTLDDLGLAGALEQVFNEEQERASWPDAEFVHNIGGHRFDKTLETTVFRVAQEALTNARRHAAATRVRLTLLADDCDASLTRDEARDGSAPMSRCLTLEVRDWGRGFSLKDRKSDHYHLGLQGMLERVHLVGGNYQLQSAPGEGTLVRAVFPAELPEDAAALCQDCAAIHKEEDGIAAAIA